jgi:hypothetical protein
MSVSINGTNGLTFNDGSTQTTSPFTGGFGFRNRIINGAMVIDQRNNGASVTIGSGVTYTLDRFSIVTSAASKLSVQQNAGSVTPPVGFSNYLGITSLSAYAITSGDYFTLQQPIEGLNMADLGWGTASASAVTLSFLVYSSLTGTFGAAIYNSAANRSYPFTYTISAANTWEQKSVTIAGDTTGTWLTTNDVGMRINWGLGVGSTDSGTAGAWTGSLKRSATGAVSVVGTNGATFYVTGAQFEKGSTATSFDYRPHGTELALCQRYFEKMPTGASGYASVRTTDWYGYIHWQTEKRANPTITLTGTVDLVGSVGDINGQTPTGIDTASVKSARIYRTGSSFVSQAAWIYVSNNIAVSAEL